MKSGQLVWSQFCVARAVCAGLGLGEMYPLGNQNSSKSKFINKELPALLFTNTTSQINGKLVTGYFESLKES